MISKFNLDMKSDSDHAPTVAVLDALKNYDVKPVFWSKREELRDELAA